MDNFVFESVYNAEELEKIFVLMCNKYQYVLDEKLKEKMPEFFRAMVLTKPSNFANAREVRNIFEKAVQRQSSRLYNDKEHTQDDLTLLKLEDVFPELAEMENEKTSEKKETDNASEQAEANTDSDSEKTETNTAPELSEADTNS